MYAQLITPILLASVIFATQLWSRLIVLFWATPKFNLGNCDELRMHKKHSDELFGGLTRLPKF